MGLAEAFTRFQHLVHRLAHGNGQDGELEADVVEAHLRVQAHTSHEQLHAHGELTVEPGQVLALVLDLGVAPHGGLDAVTLLSEQSLQADGDLWRLLCEVQPGCAGDLAVGLGRHGERFAHADLDFVVAVLALHVAHPPHPALAA